MNAKKPYRDLIEALGVSSWIGVVNNPWFDYCLPPGFFEIDVQKRTATYCKSINEVSPPFQRQNFGS